MTPTKKPTKKPLKVVTYSHCEMLTSEPGMQCPLCGAALEPWVRHHCRKYDTPEKAKK